MRSSCPSYRAAFTLVEISIVLVIIGLLAGGIVAGIALIRAAELKSISTSATSYISAMGQFKTRFRALPGDMTNATSYWGSAGGNGMSTDGACFYTGSLGTNTCNGNGNGYVSAMGDGVGEVITSWKQLQNAGLILGSYSGSPTQPVSCDGTLREGVSGIKDYGFSLATRFISDGICNSYVYGTQDQPNALMFGKGSCFGGGGIGAADLTPAEAFNIDKKMDDGFPATGKWQAALAIVSNNTMGNANAGVTSTSCSDRNGEYRLSRSQKLIDFFILSGL